MWVILLVGIAAFSTFFHSWPSSAAGVISVAIAAQSEGPSFDSWIAPRSSIALTFLFTLRSRESEISHLASLRAIEHLIAAHSGVSIRSTSILTTKFSTFGHTWKVILKVNMDTLGICHTSTIRGSFHACKTFFSPPGCAIRVTAARPSIRRVSITHQSLSITFAVLTTMFWSKIMSINNCWNSNSKMATTYSIPILCPSSWANTLAVANSELVSVKSSLMLTLKPSVRQAVSR